MTLDEIRQSERTVLVAADIADVLGSDPNTIRRQAHDDPAMLGFPVIVMGCRVKIPRAAFLRYMDGEGESA